MAFRGILFFFFPPLLKDSFFLFYGGKNLTFNFLSVLSFCFSGIPKAMNGFIFVKIKKKIDKNEDLFSSVS